MKYKITYVYDMYIICIYILLFSYHFCVCLCCYIPLKIHPGPFSLMIHVHQVGRLVLRKTHGFWPSNMGEIHVQHGRSIKNPMFFLPYLQCGFLWRSKSINICWYPHQFIADDIIAGCFHPPKTQYTNWVWTIPCVFHQFYYNSWLVVSTPLKILVSWDYYSQYMEK